MVILPDTFTYKHIYTHTNTHTHAHKHKTVSYIIYLFGLLLLADSHSGLVQPFYALIGLTL